VGSVQQAVLEFDEAVQAPWRPALRLVPAAGPGQRGPATRPGAYRDRVAGSGPARVAEAAPRPGRAVATPRVPARPAPRPRVRGGCAPQRRPGAGRLRLTRRARRLATVLALALGVALGSWLAPLLAGGDSGDLRLTGVSTVVVEPGDTLWSVAASVAGDRDVRAVVDEIQRLNDLDGVDLQAGQILQLP
jgi:LysM domain